MYVRALSCTKVNKRINKGIIMKKHSEHCGLPGKAPNNARGTAQDFLTPSPTSVKSSYFIKNYGISFKKYKLK